MTSLSIERLKELRTSHSERALSDRRINWFENARDHDEIVALCDAELARREPDTPLSSSDLSVFKALAEKWRKPSSRGRTNTHRLKCADEIAAAIAAFEGAGK